MSLYTLRVLTVALIFPIVLATSVTTEKYAKAYLERYGYLSQTNNGFMDETNFRRSTEMFEQALRKFQSFASLKITGQLDSETLNEMNKPRCGVSDIKRNIEHPQNFSVLGTTWSRTTLTYAITEYSKYYPRYWIDNALEKAFQAWSEVSPLRFNKITRGNPDIAVRFGSYDHGDGAPFDGYRGVAAHAAAPPIGDICFDDDERWSFTTPINQIYKTDFNWVALHEIGHSLGLDHTNILEAVMYPSYDYGAKAVLHEDDIRGIRYLYGSNYYEEDMK